MGKRRYLRERRKSDRLSIDIPLKYSIKRSEFKSVVADDISGGGMRMTLKEPLAKGTKLDMLIHFPEEKRPISSAARVMWQKKIKKKGKPCFMIGVQHVKINRKDRERFVLLFCEMMINYFLTRAFRVFPKN